MCRLFGMSGGPNRVSATFWLLEAPDSLAQQSRREPDGTGVGCFAADGAPEIFKQPLAAYADEAFTREAKDLESRTFVAHVRYASTGEIAPQNTHPFEQCGRLFAHNGVVEDLEALEHQLGEDMRHVAGDTDSERYFALISREIERTGDVGEGIAAATRWVAAHLPVFALSANRHLEHASARGSIRVRSGDLAWLPAVVVASEPMDEDPGWRALASGELVYVDRQLRTTIAEVLSDPPAHQLTLSDLTGKAASSQAPVGTT